MPKRRHRSGRFVPYARARAGGPSLNALAYMTLMAGLAWLLVRYADPKSRACPDCKMPGGTLTQGMHWPSCPRAKKGGGDGQA